MNPPASLHIRPRVPDDDARLLEIRHVINHDRPPMSMEEFRHAIDTQPPEAEYEHVVAEVNSKVVGDARLSRQFYLKEQNEYSANIYVDRDMWKKGIGTALWIYLL